MIPARLSRAIAKFTRAAIGLQKVREKDSIARAHTQELEQFFQAQARLVIFRMMFMQEYMPEVQQAPEPVRLMEAKNPVSTEALKRWADIWRDVEQKTTDELQQIVKGIEGDALVKGANQLAGQLKFDAKTTFSLSNPRAVEWMRKNGGSLSYIKDIQSTTAESLKRVVTTGLDEGWSYNTTAREIQKLYDGPISRQRAQLIAVTESARAYEAGNHAFAQSIEDDGVNMEKQWTTSHDDRVSDGCATNEADGWIPINEAHTSGDQEPPRFPGCRCYEQYRQARV